MSKGTMTLLVASVIGAIWGCTNGEPQSPGPGPHLYLPEEDERVVDIGVGPTELVLAFDCDAADVGLHEGQVIAGRMDGGYLRTVESVELAGQQATVATLQAALAEAVGTASLHETLSPEGTWQLASGETAGSGDLDLSGIAIFDGYTDAAELLVTATEGSFSFEPQLQLDVEVEDGSVRELEVRLGGPMSLDLTAELSLVLGFSYATEGVLASYSVPVSTTAGEVPVEGLVTVELYGGVELSIAGQGSLLQTARFDAVLDAGARYEDRQWSDSWTPTADLTSDTAPVWEMDGLTDATIYLRPVVRTTLWGVEGPAASAKPFMRADLDAFVPATWYAEAGLDGAIEVQAELFDPDIEAFQQQWTGESAMLHVSDGEWDGYSQVAAGGSCTCALTTEGEVTCWGDDTAGQCSPPEGTFSQLAAGQAHACALDLDGLPTCWGNAAACTGVPGEIPFSAIDAGRDFTCAVRAEDGAILCWGQNDSGQCAPPPGSYSTVAAGSFHACAVDTEGAVHCWGHDHAGQTDALDGSYEDVSCGETFSCGRTPQGIVRCWGCVGTDPGPCESPGTLYTSLDAGPMYACAVSPNGTLDCWGSGGASVTQPPPGTVFTDVASGGGHACALKLYSDIECWGADDQGQATPP